MENQSPIINTSATEQNQSKSPAQAEDKKFGAIVYFLGLIIVAVIAVGYLILKNTGLF